MYIVYLEEFLPFGFNVFAKQFLDVYSYIDLVPNTETEVYYAQTISWMA